LLCLAGHVQWNTVTTVGGITHLTQQSLAESFTPQGAPADAWGMLTLREPAHWQAFAQIRIPDPRRRLWQIHPVACIDAVDKNRMVGRSCWTGSRSPD